MALLLVDGESGGVGKSTFTKLLLEYFNNNTWTCKLYDLDSTKLDVGTVYDSKNYKNTKKDSDKGESFLRFTENNRTKSKVNVIFEEALENNIIVNLPSNVANILNPWLEDNGIPDLAKTYGIRFLKFFVCSGEKLSVDLFLKTVEKFKNNDSGLTHIFVLNTSFGMKLEEVESQYKSLKDILAADKIIKLSMPTLDAGYFSKIISTNVTFAHAKGDIKNELRLIGRSALTQFINKSDEELKTVFETIQFDPNQKIKIEA